MSSSEFADDLATLSRLDNDILVDQLRGRYAIDDIYTYLGDILVAVNPYRPLPLYQPDTIVQHYMQPEEFRQFFDKAYGAPPSAEEQAADARIAAVYEMFVGAKVLRR